MIHYQLKCENGHVFDGWFASSDAFARLGAAGAVTCTHCGSAKVERALMAPAIARGRQGAGAEEAEAAPAAPAAAAESAPNIALNDERAEKMRAALRALRQAVVENGVDVGRDFPEEARRIHYGDAEPRGIYGQANLEEARSLIEEGIEVLPLPPLPDDRN